MSYHHFHHLAQHADTSSGFSGAFWGAFLAFVFGLIAYTITKRRERFVQHKNALVKLERVLNKHLDELAVLKEVATDNARIMAEKKVTSNRLFKLELPENLDMEIGSVELINKYFAYRSSVDRLNFNVTTANHALTRLEDLFINGRHVVDENYTYLSGMFQSFADETAPMTERAEKLLVLTRIHLRKIRDRIPFVYGVVNTQWDHDICSHEIAQEKQKLADEIELVKKETQDNKF